MTGSARRRWPAAVALAAYAAFLGTVLLAPSARIQTAVVSRSTAALELVLPDAVVSGSRTELVLNVLVVVPFVLLAALVLPRVRWQDWTAYGFLGACAVELVQGFVLAGRSAAFADVVANALGAFVGAAGAAWWLLRREQVLTSRDDAGRG